MKAWILKVGTLPSHSYFIRSERRNAGTELSVGQLITFREQAHGSRWQHGRITGISGNMPLVELV